jgi:hypothetical protein
MRIRLDGTPAEIADGMTRLCTSFLVRSVSRLHPARHTRRYRVYVDITTPAAPDDSRADPYPAVAARRDRCLCGGTGIDSHGDTCPTCDGLGFC